MLNFIDKLYHKKISSTGMGVFRILFSLNFFFQVNRIYKYKELYFDSIPFIRTTNLSYETLLIIWMIVLVMICVGFYTRVAAIINYIFVLGFLNLRTSMEYHMDYIYIGISFLFIILPLSNSFSLDNLRFKYAHSNTKLIVEPDNKIAAFYYFLPVFLGIGLVYFGSIPYKIKSEVWLNGLGVWVPNSIPQLIINDTQWLLNNEFFIKLSGYVILLFEMVFVFLFFLKKFRIPLLIIGLVLHIGILFCYPIPFFAIGYITLYVLMLPVGLWDRLFVFFKAKASTLIFYYDEECPLCIRVKITISHFDWFKLVEFRGVQSYGIYDERLSGISKDELLDSIYSIDDKNIVREGIETYKKVFARIPVFYLLAVLLKLPGISWLGKKTYEYVASNRLVDRCTEDNCGFVPMTKKTIIDKIKLSKTIEIQDVRIFGLKFLFVFLVLMQIIAAFNNKTSNEIESYSAKFFGVAGHGVFIDSHYKGYDKVFTVSYNGELLPMFDEQGMVGEYLRGGIWADFGFRINKPNALNSPEVLEKGLIKYTSYWIRKNNIDITKNPVFDVVMKTVRAPFKWEKDLLKSNLESPWEKVGEFKWEGENTKIKIEL